jgi:nucleoside-diphosphate-sugar epimerase
VTGGSGFIASHLTESLAEKNQLVLFDRDFRNRPVEFTSLLHHPNVKVVTGDVMAADEVRNAAKGCDVVIHAAAMVGVQKVIRHPRETIEVNFIGTRNVLEAVRDPSKLYRFMYFSTSEVFGGMSFRVEESRSTSVGSVNDARWSYSIAKLAGEHLVAAYHHDVGLPSVIVRPFNVFGPRRLGDHAVLQFILRALQGLDIEVHGDGSQIRSWCYIDDFIDGLVRCLERTEAVGEDFNLGNPQNTCTILDLARRVVALTGSRSEVKFTHIDFSDIDLRVPKLTKSRALLGFDPRWHLDEALLASIEWYRANRVELPPGPVNAAAGRNTARIDGVEAPLPRSRQPREREPVAPTRADGVGPPPSAY